MLKYRFYYQIDYIDNEGLAHYVESFHNFKKALKTLTILNSANEAIHYLTGTNTRFQLDKYRYQVDKDNIPLETPDELIISNIVR